MGRLGFVALLMLALGAGIGCRRDAAPAPAPTATPATARTATETASPRALAAPPLTPTELFERVSPQVVIVEALARNGRPFGQGSGVILESGTVVTNHHVVEDASRVEVRQGGRRWPAQVARKDRAHDLALLEVPGLSGPPLPLRASREAKTGERVFAVGAPQGLELTLSEGLVSGLRTAEAAFLVQTTASISPGSSGGGLFDDRGRLLGITTFQFLGGQNLNFALPTEWLLALREGQPVSDPRKDRTATAIVPPATEVDRLCADGRKHLAGQRYAEAMASFNEALQKDPEAAPAWFGIGVVQARRGDQMGALKTYERLRSLDPPQARDLLALIRDPSGRISVESEDLPREELDRIDVVGKAAFGESLSLSVRNGTGWNLTAINVQVVGEPTAYELVSAEREGVARGATGLLRSASAPRGGWSKANWVIVGGRGFR